MVTDRQTVEPCQTVSRDICFLGDMSGLWVWGGGVEGVISQPVLRTEPGGFLHRALGRLHMLSTWSPRRKRPLGSVS